MNELDGATTPGKANAWSADAGEFAARWNAMSAERREAFVRHNQKNVEDGYACFIENHAGHLASLQQQRDAAHAVIREALAEARLWANGPTVEVRASGQVFLAILSRALPDATEPEYEYGLVYRSHLAHPDLQVAHYDTPEGVNAAARRAPELYAGVRRRPGIDPGPWEQYDAEEGNRG